MKLYPSPAIQKTHRRCVKIAKEWQRKLDVFECSDGGFHDTWLRYSNNRDAFVHIVSEMEKRYAFRHNSTQPEEEIWKPARGYPMYEVSDLGRVKSLYKNIVLKQSVSNSGYLKVALWRKDQLPKNEYVHILVAETFYDCSCPEGHIVEHDDQDKQNNRFENLLFITRAENIKKAWKAKRKREKEEQGQRSLFEKGK